jgi:hypothetical protein
MKTIERLALVPPTDEELDLGAELKATLIALRQVIGRSEQHIGAPLQFWSPMTDMSQRHVLVLPSERISRDLYGGKFHTGGKVLAEGSTTKPFIMNSMEVTGMHPQHDTIDGPVVTGRSPDWESSDRERPHFLSYRYQFPLAVHTLAVVNRQLPPVEQ